MRTPNSECVICHKALYRRPGELTTVRHVACMEHRAEAQRLAGITEAQMAGLLLGRVAGTNHRTGYHHRDDSKRKTSESHKAWCATNPEKVRARAEKTRGANHYRWHGGSSRLNASVRTLNENRKWMDAVKARDGKCLVCGSQENVEAHHLIPLAVLMEEYEIVSRDQARDCQALWDLSNGQTLCARHHYAVHGRRYED